MTWHANASPFPCDKNDTTLLLLNSRICTKTQSIWHRLCFPSLTNWLRLKSWERPYLFLAAFLELTWEVRKGHWFSSRLSCRLATPSYVCVCTFLFDYKFLAMLILPRTRNISQLTNERNISWSPPNHQGTILSALCKKEDAIPYGIGWQMFMKKP